uniref:Interleukin-6 n=1 Tax=Steinernema glaseri TaxID=37863 RepID=A0A1I7YZ39_9BILA
MMLSASVWAIFLLFSSASGYLFACLDKCECDTEDEIIHCHNGARTQVMLPENRLRGFVVIGLTNNNIRFLPSEELLLEKFPDLMAIDVEANTDFDCETLEHYNKIKILSNCGKENGMSTIVTGVTVPGGPEAPTESCDIACQMRKHVETLQQYAKKVWTVIKQKIRDFDKDQFLQDVQDFFANIVRKIADSQKQS